MPILRAISSDQAAGQFLLGALFVLISSHLCHAVDVGNLDGNGDVVVTPDSVLTVARIRQNSLSIQGGASQDQAFFQVRRSGTPSPNPQGSDAQLSTLNSLSLANNGLPITAPPPGGFGSAIRQYFGSLDLVNNDLVIKNGSPSLFAETQDMIRAGLFTSGDKGIYSSEALFTGEHAGFTWLGSLYNGIDNDNNPGTPDVPLLSSFGGVSLVGGEILVKYTWFGDADLDGLVDGNDATQFTTGFSNGDPVNQAINSWFFGDFDYNGIIDGNDATFFTTSFTGGGNTTHLPEPGTLALLTVALALVGLSRGLRPGRRPFARQKSR